MTTLLVPGMNGTGTWRFVQTSPPEPEAPERDERLIDHVTRIDSECRGHGVDPVGVVPELEQVVRGAYELREAAKDLTTRERRVIGDAVAGGIREILS